MLARRYTTTSAHKYFVQPTRLPEFSRGWGGDELQEQILGLAPCRSGENGDMRGTLVSSIRFRTGIEFSSFPSMDAIS